MTPTELAQKLAQYEDADTAIAVYKEANFIISQLEEVKRAALNLAESELRATGETDTSGDHRLHPAAPEEAKLVYHEAMKAAGQMEMPGVEPAEEKPLPEWLAEPEGQLDMFGEESELDHYFPRSGVPYPD